MSARTKLRERLLDLGASAVGEAVAGMAVVGGWAWGVVAVVCCCRRESSEDWELSIPGERLVMMAVLSRESGCSGRMGDKSQWVWRGERAMERARMAESGRWEWRLAEVSLGGPVMTITAGCLRVSSAALGLGWLHWAPVAALGFAARDQVPGTRYVPTASPDMVMAFAQATCPAFQHSSLRLQPISIYPNASSRRFYPYNYSSKESISTVPFVSRAALMAWHTRNAASPA